MVLKVGIDTEGLDRGFEVAIEAAKDYLLKYPETKIFLYILEENLDKAKKIIGKNESIHLESAKLSATPYVDLGSIISDIKGSFKLSPEKPIFSYTMTKILYDCLTKKIDTCIIPGHAGHLMAIARTLERLLGLHNPYFPQAFGTLIPNIESEPRLMLDLGAFLTQDLFKLGVLGESFMRHCYKIKNPKVGFLNIGSEESKGPLEIREAASIYKRFYPDNLYGQSGFIEPNKIYSKNKCDVIVCNALNGNLALKASEGVYDIFKTLLKDSSKRSFLHKILTMGIYFLLKDTLKQFDPDHHNSAITFGFSALITKAHGGSSRRSIFYSIQNTKVFHKYYHSFCSDFSKKAEELFATRSDSTKENQE